MILPRCTETVVIKLQTESSQPKWAVYTPLNVVTRREKLDSHSSSTSLAANRSITRYRLNPTGHILSALCSVSLVELTNHAIVYIVSFWSSVTKQIVETHNRVLLWSHVGVCAWCCFSFYAR